MVLKENITVDREAIAEFCRRNHIRKLSLFGSVLTDRFSPESDVDVLVEFEPGTRTGFAFFAMEAELSAMLGQKVDLNTRGFLGEDIHSRVSRVAEVLYSAE